jgi:hypothetical protein
MGISFAAAGAVLPSPHWLSWRRLGAPGLFLALVGLAILLYSKLVPSDRPVARPERACQKSARCKNMIKRLALRQTRLQMPRQCKFEQDKRSDLGVGIALLFGSAGAIAGASDLCCAF